LFLLGLFRYAIIHSGSPIAHWFISDCVQSSRKRTYPSDCKPGTSRFTKRRPTYKELMEASVDNFAFNKGEVMYSVHVYNELKQM
jgi:hypothetical protein